MSQQQPSNSDVTGPADPEHDPRATYAIDPALCRRLAARIVSSSGDSKTSYAPFTGQPIAALPLSSVDDVDEAVRRARAAQEEWRRTSLAERSKILLRLHDLVLNRQEEILDLIQWESGKARRHAFEEVAHVAMTARYYARTLQRHLAPERRPGALPGLTRVDAYRQPKGVVGVISPWNYPFTMALSDALPALMAGNAIVAKPDSQTPVTALLGIELLHEAGLPEGVWQVVYGPGAVVGMAIVDRADYICFTGSTATDKLVAARAADRLIGYSLELGGKNPMIVAKDANLDRAASTALRACYGSAGQLCVSIERLYVAEQVYDDFLARLVPQVSAMQLSTALDYSADMGSMVSQTQVDTTMRHIADATTKGARVLAGGEARTDVGPYFHEPTVLENVSDDATCFAEETFGPLVSVYPFKDEDEAVRLANQGRYGLNASVWTRDHARGRKIATQIKAGTVNINEGYAASFGSLSAPMGGMRESGVGRRQGAEGILRYTDSQAVVTQRLISLAPLPGMSFDQYAKVMTFGLRALKTLRRP